ncbi:diguanylate cyclase domain-containing protein [Lysobacter tyrosinilyticus]
MKDRELVQALLDSPSSHAIVVTDLKGEVMLWNRGAVRIFGYTSPEIVGTSAERLFVPNDRKNGIAFQEMNKAREDGCAGDFRWHIRKNGTMFWGDGMMYPVRIQGRHIGYMKIVRDATAQKLREDEHERLAFVDALTGLPNRGELYRRMVDMLGSAQRHDELLVLHLIDLDEFKEVNDSHGHPAGDTVLIEIARRMGAALRTTDLLARLGGDEFAVLQPAAHDIPASLVVAEKLLHEIMRPISIGETEVSVSGSIGISVYPTDATDMEQLVEHADVALYQAKAEGRNRYKVYDPSDAAAACQLRAGQAGEAILVEPSLLGSPFQPPRGT